MNNLKHYIWLLGISVLAIWQVPNLPNWSPNVLALINYLPYLIITFGVFISLFMNRFLSILLLSFIGLLSFSLSYYIPVLGEDAISSEMLICILPLLLAVNLVLWTWLPEKGISATLYNTILSVVFLSQVVLVYYVMDSLPLKIIEILNKGASFESLNIPILVVVVLLISWLFIVLRNAYVDNVSVMSRATIFILVLMVFAFNQFEQPFVFIWLSSVSALLVLIAIIFDSHKIAYTDELTGIPSRRALLESFPSLGKKYAISMIDIDHFKKFNDSYGHDVGDKVLSIVANELTKISVGKAYRFGGEEFTIVFPRKSIEQVESALEEVRKNIESTNLDFIKTDKKKVKPKITVSFGLAERQSEHKKPEEVLKLADKALYDAKKAGRNRVKIYHAK